MNKILESFIVQSVIHALLFLASWLIIVLIISSLNGKNCYRCPNHGSFQKNTHNHLYCKSNGTIVMYETYNDADKILKVECTFLMTCLYAFISSICLHCVLTILFYCNIAVRTCLYRMKLKNNSNMQEEYQTI